MGIKITKQHLEEHHHDQLHYHIHSDPHKSENKLADVILGGQDGLVNVLGIVLGVAAATQDTHIVLIAGLAATFAESISMAAVAYTTSLAETAHYESEREREYRHVHLVPTVERREIQEIYRRKGFEGELLDQIVEIITSDPDVWVGVMMAEEHQLTPTTRGDALRSALVVGLAAIIGSLIPLVPFMLAPVAVGLPLSLLLSAIILFLVGFYKARTTVGHPAKSGLEMAAIGIVSALVGYFIGMLLKTPAVP